MTAGADYLAALDRLGLRPEALFWAEDILVGEKVLVLVTSAYDVAGPLALSSTLMQAYVLAATPRDIDPFVIRLHSPRQTAIRELANVYGYAEGGPAKHLSFSFEADDKTLRVEGSWVYRFDLYGAHVRGAAERRWRHFSASIDKMAA